MDRLPYYYTVNYLLFCFQVVNTVTSEFECEVYMYTLSTAWEYVNWVLVAMTVERFIAIRFPLKATEYHTKRKAALIMAVILIVVALFNITLAYSFESVFNPRTAIRECNVKVEYQQLLMAWSWVDGSIASFLPTASLFLLNGLIVHALRRSSIQQLAGKQDKKAKEQRHITIMLLVLSTFFLLSTFPFAVFLIVMYMDWWKFQTSPWETAKFEFVYIVVNSLADLNHAANFYLYFLSGRKFRRAFLAIFCACRTNKQTTDASVTYGSTVVSDVKGSAGKVCKNQENYM